MKRPLFGILVLNYNGRRWLPGLYDSLRADGYLHKLVYLVDNGSSDGSQEFTRGNFPEVAILQMPQNLGYSGAYNVAIQHAFAHGCEWVCWQNSDTLVLSGWLERMADTATSDPRIGVMGPVFRDWDSDGPNYYMKGRRPEVIPFMEDCWHPPVDCDWVEGSALLVRRECFEDVGPLDERLFMYWEEADFCRRARHCGWRVVIVPGSVNRHFGGGSLNGNGAPEHISQLKLRNHYVYKLCNPDQGFLLNLARTGLAFLSSQRHALVKMRSPRLSWAQTRAFYSTCIGVRNWYVKWKEDRERGKSALQSLKCKVKSKE